MGVVLELKSIQKKFGDLEILAGLDFSLHSGEMAIITGTSGAGKSTLLHISGLMERPSNGQVYINGIDTGPLKENDRARTRLDQIGFLFQFHYLLPELDVLENTLIPTKLAGEDHRKATGSAKNLLERLGLSDRIHHRPNQLSGGEQQRTALARALIRKPKILLCDEPTGNLDEHTSKTVWDLITAEVDKENVATVVVTHNQSLASRARMSYHLANGKLSELTPNL